MAIHIPELVFTTPPILWHNPGDPPPPWARFVFSLLNSVALRTVSEKLNDETKGKALTAMLDAQIAADIDDLCPPPRKVPIGPGPHHFAFAVISELTLVAASLSEGPLQTEVRKVTVELAGRASESML